MNDPIQQVGQTPSQGHITPPNTGGLDRDDHSDQAQPTPTLPTLSDKELRRQKQISTMKTVGASTLGAIVLATTMKDGVTKGFQRIGDISNAISNVIALPFSFLFPTAIARNEKATLEGKSHDDSTLNRMVYTAASLGFAPNTWGDPLKMGTRSKAHMAATILNLPHILFTFFSYTGGRLMSFIKAVEKNLPKNDGIYRLEQEFSSLYQLGNLGSAQASVIPMSGQFILGWETICDLFKGDFRSVGERFKKEPISVILGTLFNSWMWPFEHIAKCLDTTIRTAESVDQFKNASSNHAFQWVVEWVTKGRDWWHKTSQNKDTFGNILKYGRAASKMEALLIPPIGMLSVVTPVFNKFLRGEFFNKEAQEIGGPIASIDKIFNIGAFFTHLYYTGIYALSIRIPQTITTGIFYGSHLLSKITGKRIEPKEVREKLFGKGLVKKISDQASIWLDYFELKLHPEHPTSLINELKINKNTNQFWIDGKEYTKHFEKEFSSIKAFVDKQEGIQVAQDENGNEIITLKGSGKSKHIRSFHKAIAEEVCYVPLKEELYANEINDEYQDEGLIEEARKKGKEHNGLKARGMKPSQQKWLDILKSKGENEIIDKVKETLDNYLRDSQLLDEEQRNIFMTRELDQIKHEVAEFLKDEKEAVTKDLNKAADNNNHNLSLNDILKFKSFHAVQTVLPLWVRGFVDVVDYGEETDPFWLRNLKATESGIREGDIKQACDREFMPVVGYSLQSAGKGLAILWNLCHGRMPQFAE